MRRAASQMSYNYNILHKRFVHCWPRFHTSHCMKLTPATNEITLYADYIFLILKKLSLSRKLC